MALKERVKRLEEHSQVTSGKELIRFICGGEVIEHLVPSSKPHEDITFTIGKGYIRKEVNLS